MLFQIRDDKNPLAVEEAGSAQDALVAFLRNRGTPDDEPVQLQADAKPVVWRGTRYTATIPFYGQLLSSLRLLRLTRLLRLLRAGVIIARALQAERRMSSGQTLRFVALLTLFIVVVAGASQAAFNANEFESVWVGAWWAIQTVTTVGYGDVPIVDTEGRLIAIAVMLVGIGFLSVLTAATASFFIKTDTGSDEVMETLRRIEADVAELKTQIAGGQTSPGVG